MKKLAFQRLNLIKLFILPIGIFLITGCVKPITDTTNDTEFTDLITSDVASSAAESVEDPNLPPMNQPGGSQHQLEITPAFDENNPFIKHTVEEGETVGIIADQYDVSPDEIIAFNQIEDVNLIFAGEELLIPGPEFQSIISPDFKIIPDSELVYGPASEAFDAKSFIESYDGYLNNYQEEVEEKSKSGPEILQLVADRHSTNPRLLLAALEYHSGWLTEKEPEELTFPMGNKEEDMEGLYKQLSWAANLLNWGYYGRSEGGLTSFLVADFIPAEFSQEINHGTAGVQFYLAARDDINYDAWVRDLGPDGIYATYTILFGDPFSFAFEPLIPEDLEQPPLTLPWESGEAWYFTGGPHGGWNTGSAWAALDFVPPDVQGGCSSSESWVVSMSDGIVTRSGDGAVVVDLDGDGYTGTGWAIVYMHLANEDRILVGVEVETGDKLGHPGCEGGFANGTHLHVARTYNGRWISADGTLPIVMDDWVSGGSGFEYNGWLSQGDIVKTADIFLTEANAITAK